MKKVKLPEGKKFNLTIVDKDAQVDNFLYRGVSEADRGRICAAYMGTGEATYVLSFAYDDGHVLTRIDSVHTLVFSDYMTEEDEVQPEEE